jgi:UDP-glucose 6-dehydrogenase
MKTLCVIGTGYVGLPTAACFADMGNTVITVDIDERKIQKLLEGHMPIYEPGLEELVERNVKAGRLRFTTDYDEGLKDADFVFICVGTPSAVDGEADLKYVRAAAQTIAQKMTKPLIVINKSTVPVGTGDWTHEIISKAQPTPIDFAVVSCPEFLREGAAISDFMKPDRTVLGSNNRQAAESVASLYTPLNSTIVITDIRTAEMIKYASNAFLATKISFINEISIICERLGADVTEVAQGMGYDTRIGNKFLQAGVGYGGSCFTADETIFTLNSPNVVAEKIADVFNKTGGDSIEGDVVEVKVPIEKRVLGFDLATGQSKLADVTAITRRPYQGTMVTVKTSMGREMRVTADHPVILNNGGQFRIIPAIDVAPGDQVMTLMGLPLSLPLAERELVIQAVGQDNRLDAHNNSIATHRLPLLTQEIISDGLAKGICQTLTNQEVAIWQYTTTQKSASDTMLLMVQSLGIMPTIHRTMTHNILMTYQLQVSNPQDIVLLQEVFGDTNQFVYANYQMTVEAQRGFEQPNADYAVLTVQDVEYQLVDTHVYSLETSEGTVITSDAIISHNCFPKDVKALANMAMTHGMHPQLLNAVMEINDFQRKHLILKVRDLIGGTFEGKTIGVLGLAFKENTDDMRESPASTVVRSIMNQGATVKAYDPMAMENAEKEMKGVVMCQSAYEAAENADAIILLTPWNEFKQLDMARIKGAMREPIMVDGRNMYDPETMRQHGFIYRGVGRGFNGEGLKAED